jgi:hypothetical protein
VTRGAITAVLALACSAVVAAPPSRVPARELPARAQRGPEKGAREFEYRGVRFTLPVGWTVQRAEERAFRSELVTVRGAGAGPQLTFSPAVQPAREDRMPLAGNGAESRTGGGLSVARYAMPNAAWHGVLYVLPEAGITVSAQVRSEAESRAADAVVQSARRVLPVAGPKRG